MTLVCEGRLQKRDFLSKYSAFFKSSYANMQVNANVIKTALASQSIHPDDVFNPAELDGAEDRQQHRETVPPAIPDDSGTPHCDCGVFAGKKTVTKAGPTKGRTFFCLSNADL